MKEGIFILDFKKVKWGTKSFFLVKDLYLSAFPEDERFSILHLVIMALQKDVYFEAIYEDNEFVGLIFMASGKTAVYLCYLAVVLEKRGHGYGSSILKDIKERFSNKQIILDIEPVNKAALNYAQRQNRLQFYLKNGFNQTPKNLVDENCRFSICTTGKTVKSKNFTALLRHMTFGLYKFKIE